MTSEKLANTADDFNQSTKKKNALKVLKVPHRILPRSTLKRHECKNSTSSKEIYFFLNWSSYVLQKRENDERLPAKIERSMQNI